MKTILDFKAVQTDSKAILLLDASVYNPLLPIKNGQYRVIVPNFNKYVDIPFEPGQIVAVNSSVLNITPGIINPLPAGPYHIRQSIAPNDKLYLEHVHFNIYPALELIAKNISEDNEDDVTDLYVQLLIAKDVAEMCDPDQGTSIYNEVTKQLDKIFSCTKV